MAPKKKIDEEEFDEDLDEELEEKPKKKAPAPRKKKAAASPGEDGEPKAKKPRAKTEKVTEAFTDPNGWTIQPPSLIYKADPNAQGGKRIAAFDLDGTLTVTKSGAQFPKGEDDWKWLNKQVASKLHELAADGYQIVIFSNQGGIKSALTGKGSQNTRNRVDHMLADLRKNEPLPVQVFMATLQDDYRKPEAGMWQFFVENCNQGVEPDKSDSFFVGDAAGRVGDFEKTDKEFAENIGIAFKTPEEVFGEPDSKKASKLAEGGDSGLNGDLAGAFFRLADKARSEGANQFKVSAYEKVAKILAGWPEKITSSKQVAKEKGVGKSSIAKIEEFLKTGTLSALEGDTVGVVAPKDDTALKFLDL